MTHPAILHFKYNDIAKLNREELKEHVEGTIIAFSEWCKHVISEERRVSVGLTGLVLNQCDTDDGITYWFSIDTSLWH